MPTKDEVIKIIEDNLKSFKDEDAKKENQCLVSNHRKQSTCQIGDSLRKIVVQTYGAKILRRALLAQNNKTVCLAQHLNLPIPSAGRRDHDPALRWRRLVARLLSQIAPVTNWHSLLSVISYLPSGAAVKGLLHQTPVRSPAVPRWSWFHAGSASRRGRQ